MGEKSPPWNFESTYVGIVLFFNPNLNLLFEITCSYVDIQSHVGIKLLWNLEGELGSPIDAKGLQCLFASGIVG